MSQYQVAFSFASEDREYVGAVAETLRQNGVSVFYDAFEETNLWGKDLYRHLGRVYKDLAEFTVVFISQAYARKAWSQHELRNAQARAFSENREYVLPARFDDTEIEGLLPTVGYVDLRHRTPAEFARLILDKLGQIGPTPAAPPAAPPPRREMPQAPQAPTATGADLLQALGACSATELTSLLLRGQVSPEALGKAIKENPAAVREMIHAICRRHHEESDTWLRMMTIFACSRLTDPSEPAMAVAFDDAYHWGARTLAMTWLRFCRPASASVAGDRLFTRAEGGMDDKRLVMAGLGYLGDYTKLVFLQGREDVQTDKYANGKLGPYVLRAYLDCFIHHGEGWLPGDPLESMIEVFDTTRGMSNLHLHPFDFHKRLRVLNAGGAKKLLDFLARRPADLILQPLLWVLGDRPSRYAMGTLRRLAESHANAQVKSAALTALGRIPAVEATDLVRQLLANDPSANHGALMLSIGTNRSADAFDMVAAVINQTPDSSGEHHDALWAIGQLGRAAPERAAAVLRPAAQGADDPSARAMGWLGLAKAGKASTAELEDAMDAATEFYERVIIGIAGATAGSVALLEKGLHASQRNHAPVWRLASHLYGDLNDALETSVGPAGPLLAEMLRLGDVD
jgi:hypothetical protein